MIIAYKIVKDDYSSLSDRRCRVIYGTDWQVVPGNGAYCSVTGTGIAAGGVGPRLIRLEVMERGTGLPPNGVTTWRRVRRLDWQPTAAQQAKLDAARTEYDAACAKYDAAWTECEAARTKLDAACAKYDAACAKRDAAWTKYEAVLIQIIAEST